jgi:mono/diheme cytochrome c family protein
MLVAILQRKVRLETETVKINLKVFPIAAALTLMFCLPSLAGAQSDAIYKSKCAMCHGADGKKAAGHDLSGPDVQKESDAELNAVITNGKLPKMPKYGDKLKPEEIQGLVAYIRTLKK